MSSATHYEVLEVSPTASLDSIKASFHKKARKYHPDKRTSNGRVDEEQAFLDLQKAWQCLRDPISRKEYDELLLKQQTQTAKSTELALDDWELVEEEDSGDLCFLYSCRCGEDLWLPQRELESGSIGSKVYVRCDGCSLVFHVIRPESV